LPAAYVFGAVRLALMQLRLEEAPAAARRTVDAALARYPLATLDAADRPYPLLVSFFAEAGQPDRARRLLAEYETVIPEAQRRGEPARHRAAASIAFAEGRLEDAIRGYRAWDGEAQCTRCALYALATVYDRAGRHDSALAVYERAVTTPGQFRVFDDAVNLGPAYRRLGELYEQQGNAGKARQYYGLFVDLWRDADPELQPAVRDVRSRLARLAGERVGVP